MQSGVFTQWIQAETIEGLAERVHELGLQCVVLDSFPGLDIDLDHPQPEVCQRIRHAFERAGVAIAAVGGYSNLVHPDPVEHQAIQTRFLGLLQLCAEIGSPMLCSEAGTYHPSDEWNWDPANATEQAFTRLRETLRPVLKAASAYGVQIGLEPYVMSVLHTPERAARLMQELNSPFACLVCDPAGMLNRVTLEDQEAFLLEAFQLISPSIGLVHVEDCRPDPNGHFLWLAAGQGLINYPLFMDLLVQSGYRGPLILEHLSESDLSTAREYVLTHWHQAIQRAEGR
ncbi:MAG TPA: sugar phosphate isomerase/epimerase family protein [Ktedonobacteraceae bacterium]